MRLELLARVRPPAPPTPQGPAPPTQVRIPPLGLAARPASITTALRRLLQLPAAARPPRARRRRQERRAQPLHKSNRKKVKLRMKRPERETRFRLFPLRNYC